LGSKCRSRSFDPAKCIVSRITHFSGNWE
jgi:hypothetical protein